MYIQRESKRRIGEVFFVQPKRIEDADAHKRGLIVIQREIEDGHRTGLLCTAKRESKRLTVQVFFVLSKRIEEEYRRGLFCTAKENRRGVQERTSLYSQIESKRSTGDVFFV